MCKTIWIDNESDSSSSVFFFGFLHNSLNSNWIIIIANSNRCSSLHIISHNLWISNESFQSWKMIFLIFQVLQSEWTQEENLIDIINPFVYKSPVPGWSPMTVALLHDWRDENILLFCHSLTVFHRNWNFWLLNVFELWIKVQSVRFDTESSKCPET